LGKKIRRLVCQQAAEENGKVKDDEYLCDLFERRSIQTVDGRMQQIH